MRRLIAGLEENMPPLLRGDDGRGCTLDVTVVQSSLAEVGYIFAESDCAGLVCVHSYFCSFCVLFNRCEMCSKVGRWI